MVALLLADNVLLDVKGGDGWTALMGSAKNGHDAVVCLLLEAKASVDLQDTKGWTALMWSA